MLSGIVSSDIVGSTSIHTDDKLLLLKELKNTLFSRLKSRFDTYTRIAKGDMIECYIPNPADTLRVALIIKCFIKSRIAPRFSIISRKKPDAEQRNRYFKIHGVRMAIAVDDMEKIDKRKGVLEGEAIYKTGRMLGEYHTYDKQRIVIKNSMFFLSGNKELQEEFEVIVMLMDALLLKTTSRQCELLTERLFEQSESEIADQLGISQSGVNQGLRMSGWPSIDKALKLFEKTSKN
jgi:predicted DNA-binding protein YlxM (UPF0122 family)